MNYQEQKTYTSVLLIQGSYYSILGMLLIYLGNFSPFYIIPDSAEAGSASKLIGGLLFSIGVTLLISHRKFKQNNSIFLLGFLTSLTFSLHHTFFLYHYEAMFYMSIDLILELSYLLVWIWLSYWKWIENKFADL
tara:strand:- start:155392 stop:155796 length:405 start_codon:yes stop_codon:yes gene_type:complete